jgi:hypothetical protein
MLPPMKITRREVAEPDRAFLGESLRSVERRHWPSAVDASCTCSSPLAHNIAQRVREQSEAFEQPRRLAARKVEARRQSGLDAHFCC